MNSIDVSRADEVLPDTLGEFPRGRVFVWVSPRAPGLETFVYLPRSLSSPGRALVAVHGITRNATEHALLFSALAEEAGVAVIAPLFATNRFRGYQTLRRRRKGPAAEVAFDFMLDDLRTATGLDLNRLSLFGFSGGGQFAHRYAMVRPDKVDRLVVGAAGWYTFPDVDQDYPRGVAALPEHLSKLDLDAFLKIPVLVVVGDQDQQRDDALNQDPRIDARQGRTRVERGQNWVRALKAAALERGLPTRAGIRLLHGGTHSFADSMNRLGLGQIVFNFLFGDSEMRKSAAGAASDEHAP